MKTRFLLMTLFIVLVPILSACAQESVTQVQTTGPGPVGEISRELDIVEHGPSADNLKRVEDSDILNPGDALRVTRGGEGVLDFGGFLRLRLFNDTQLDQITIESAENAPLIARLVLERGGFTGNLTEEGSKAHFETPGGAEITVLGTTFFIVYDPRDGTTTLGNFDGVVGAVSGGQIESLSPGHFFSIPAGGPPGPEQPIPITREEFNAAARELQSPIEVVNTRLLGVPTPTDSPFAAGPSLTPTPPPTQTATPTSTATSSATPVPPTPTITPLACPPLITVDVPAFCREGPGTNYRTITGFEPQTTLIVEGQSPFTPRWWWVEIPTGGHCWISDAVVEVEGDTSMSCVAIIDPPPTYTPVPPTPTPTAAPTLTATTPPPPPTNIPPEVTILSPQDGAEFTYDGYDQSQNLWFANVKLVGRASDPDGTLIGSLKWQTNRTDIQEARLGIGPDLEATLYSNVCEGVNHDITVTVVDNDGATSTDTISIRIWTLC